MPRFSIAHLLVITLLAGVLLGFSRNFSVALSDSGDLHLFGWFAVMAGIVAAVGVGITLKEGAGI